MVSSGGVTSFQVEPPSGEQHMVTHDAPQATDRPAGVGIDHMDGGDGELLPGGEMLDWIDRRWW